MKLLKFLLVGILFGITLAKAEIISWYRIFEMFHFDAFHMYGVIGSAVAIGATGIYLMKHFNVKDIEGAKIDIPDKNYSITRYLVGGTIFGLGWALVGACPGPMFILLGYGYLSILIVILSAIGGTFLYGVLRTRLPH